MKNQAELNEKDLVYYKLIISNQFKNNAEAERNRVARQVFFRALLDISAWLAFLALIALILVACTYANL